MASMDGWMHWVRVFLSRKIISSFCFFVFFVFFLLTLYTRRTRTPSPFRRFLSFHKSIFIAFTSCVCVCMCVVLLLPFLLLLNVCYRRRFLYLHKYSVHYEHVSCILIYSFCCHRAFTRHQQQQFTDSPSSPTH